MRTHGVRVGVAVAAAALAVLGLAAPTYAERFTSADARGDVLRVVDDPKDPDDWPDWEPDKTQANGDVARVAIDFRQDLVTVRIRFRELSHRDPVLQIGFGYFYPTDIQLNYADLVLTARKGNWAGKLDPVTVPSCRARHVLDYAADLATIRIPISCFEGKPAWLRAKVWVATTDSLRHPTYYNVDDVPNLHGRPEVWTRRIHRG